MRFVFTFPVSDAKRRDHYVVVEAHDETAARCDMIDIYGRNGWAFCYPSENDPAITKYGLTEIGLGL